ncbi:hypothetical protein BC830DRAFT_1137721 [Chytriomyces sp. MP71]|nr:hypothetical protein BC830DRAFT_1137721 [Chytriomyces sp. MP71]
MNSGRINAWDRINGSDLTKVRKCGFRETGYRCRIQEVETAWIKHKGEVKLLSFE